MNRIALLALAFAALLTSCAQLGQIYGGGAPRLTPAARAALIDSSARTSSVVFADDTTYYIGRPVFRSLVRANSYQSAVDLWTLSGTAVVTVYQEDPRTTPNSYRVIFDSPHKIVSATSTGGIEEVVKKLLERNVIAPNTAAYNSANLRSAIGAGILRERPDLDSAYEQNRRREIAEEQESRARRNAAPTFSSGSSSSTSKKSTEETEAEKTQRRFMTAPSVRNTGGKSVRVFVGDNPQYGNGTSMTISGNSVNSSLSGLHAGVKFWIIDDRDHPITSITVEESTREIEIGSDGKTLRQK